MSGALLAATAGGNRFSVSIGTAKILFGSAASRTFLPTPVSVVGGVGALTYLWSYVDLTGGVFGFSIANGTTATATLSTTGYTIGDIGKANLICTVTDSLGVSVASDPVLYEYICNTFGFGGVGFI